MSGGNTALTRYWWEAAAAGRLCYQACAACGASQFPPRARCSACGALDRLEWRESCAAGVIHSHTEVWRAPSPAFRNEVPYTLVLVEMTEGFRLLMRLEAGAQASIGLPVRVVFRPGVEGGPPLTWARPEPAA